MLSGLSSSISRHWCVRLDCTPKTTNTNNTNNTNANLMCNVWPNIDAIPVVFLENVCVVC